MGSRTRRSIGCAACVVGCVACGPALHYRANGSERAPEVRADVAVEVEGPVRDLDLEVHDLPAPAEVAPDATRYAVWMIERGGSTTRLGTLRYDSDVFYGDLETKIPLEPVVVMVTAEHGTPPLPSDRVVFRRTIP